MENLITNLENCYGIGLLNHSFDFRSSSQKHSKAYAIYAPNGCMKSSFAKTFEQLSLGKLPTEERYQRQSACQVTADGISIAAVSIYVLKAEIDLKAEIPAVTDLLVKPEQKVRYDELVVDLEKKKQKALTALNKISGGVAKKKIEEQIPTIFGANNLLEAFSIGLAENPDSSLSVLNYNTIFDEKALKVIQGKEFRGKATEFNQRYDELFQMENTIYSKGQFNPARAEAAFGSLKKERFFATGHRVQLRGENTPINEAELQIRLDAIHARIDGDQTLQKLRKDLANTAEARSLTDLIESLDNHQFDYLVEQTRPENEKEFRKKLWIYYLHQTPDAKAYCDEYSVISSEIKEIERQAVAVVPAWEAAVARFNRRFLNMPFTLKIANQRETALGQQPARLLFVFEEQGQSPVEWQKADVITLSQGERRAMHLLSFIFEVEARKQSGQKTLFICDDPADSFDYKNKHAIVQYLEDLTKVEHFYQIILTHNFDLSRTLTRFVHRDRCLSAIRASDNSIRLQRFDGIENIFIKMWKPKVAKSNSIMLASIPFTRNLIEYTVGKECEDYKKLTSLLHWKEDTSVITVGDYFGIYNRLFNTTHSEAGAGKVYDLFLSEATLVCAQGEHDETKLENKVLISISTRIQAEKWMTEVIRLLKKDPSYWCKSNSQFGALLGEYKQLDSNAAKIEMLEGVGITVSSNIHLNSFMYEPILDLSIDHLCGLYRTVSDL